MAVEVNVVFQGGKKVDGEINGFTVHTDQPEKDGGEGSAPTPSQLFLVSLATCAGLYAQGFCKSRELSTEGLGVSMSCEFDEKVKRYTKMQYDVTLPKDFPEKYQKSILRAINMCFVKKHLEHPPEFSSRIVT